MAQVSWALRPAADWPAASRVASRPPGATLAARSLVCSAAQAPRCGTSISGQTQPMFSGFTVRAADFPGQNGRNVRAASSSPAGPLSWAASGYTPNVCMPAWLTFMVSDHGWAPCAGTRDDRVSCAPGTGKFTTSPCWPAKKLLMDCRLATGMFDDQSCTDRPASGADVGLAMIPDTETLPLGRAMVGVIDVIAIHGCARAGSPPSPAGAAVAGPAVSNPAPAAAARAHPRAASRKPRRPRCCRRHAMPKCYCRSSAYVYPPQ